MLFQPSQMACNFRIAPTHYRLKIVAQRAPFQPVKKGGNFDGFCVPCQFWYGENRAG